LRRIRGGDNVAPRFPTQLVSARAKAGFRAVGFSGIEAKIPGRCRSGLA
jgi:hypothetical protein